MKGWSGFQLSLTKIPLVVARKSAPFRSRCAVLLEGELDQEILQEALRVPLERHESLRTQFQSLPGLDVPLQVLTERCQPDYRKIDLSNLDARSQQARVEEIVGQTGDHPFEPPNSVGFVLLSLSTDRHVLCVSVPSLCADSISLLNVMNEVANAYALASPPEALSDSQCNTLITLVALQLLRSRDGQAAKVLAQTG
jgi:hypothetical protein